MSLQMPPSSLSHDERRGVEAALSDAWGAPASVTSAEPMADREHVLRLTFADGRTAVLKRLHRGLRRRPAARTPAGPPTAGAVGAFAREWAALAFLSRMPEPVAPRLLAADPERHLLVLEEIPGDRSLAGSLLGGSAEVAAADVVAYARAMASMHAWSITHADELEAASRGRGLQPSAPPGWVAALGQSQHAFVQLLQTLGISSTGVEQELATAGVRLRADACTGLVHGDACPDNVRLDGTRCRFVDFEWAGVGSVALDAAYLVAPFPSCWCFAPLPEELQLQALGTYVDAMADGGVVLGDDFGASVAASLGIMIAARARSFVEALEGDGQWGTTGMRSRLLVWTGSFLAHDATRAELPRLSGAVGALDDMLRPAWLASDAPDYPALAAPGRPLARVPDGWGPGD